jgi:hypothetical protein
LLNARGRVVGINTARLPWAQGIGFAVPSSTASWVSALLLRHGNVRRRYLGIAAKNEVLAPALAELVGQPRGVRVVEIGRDTPASSGGLAPDDLVLKVGADEVQTIDDLQRQLAFDSSSVIDLTVNSRNSHSMTAATTMTLGWSAGPSSHDDRPLTFEVEGGRRNQLSGQLGATTAAFSGGNAFTITPDALKGGWLGEARVLTGGFDYTMQFAATAQQTLGKTDLGFHASLSMAF